MKRWVGNKMKCWDCKRYKHRKDCPMLFGSPLGIGWDFIKGTVIWIKGTKKEEKSNEKYLRQKCKVITKFPYNQI